MAANDLCTLDQIKDYIGMTGSNAVIDTVIESIITSVTELFQSMCGVKQFKSKSYTEYYSGDNKRSIFLNQRPVISVESVSIDSDWTWSADSTIGSDEYMVINNEVLMKNDTFTYGDANIKVIYNAGYATIPDDLKLACIMETARIFKKRDNIDVTSKSYGDGGSVTKYMEGMLPEVKIILKKYRNIGVF